MSKTIYEKLEINVCKILCDDNQGTGFLISNELILTAFHIINGCEKIKVTFYNKKELEGTLHELIDDKYKELDIAILKLNNSVDFYEEIPILDIKIKHNAKWISKGFPSFSINSGENILEHIDNVVNGQNSLLNSNDIRLDFNQKLNTYQGFSGSPLIIDNSIVGIIKDEQLERGSAKELKALSIQYFKDLLICLNIVVTNEILNQSCDDISSTQWEKLSNQDKTRNLKDKIIEVCSEISEKKVKSLNRSLNLGKMEQKVYSERDISAVKYVIFEKCQNRLIDFYDLNKGKKKLESQELKVFIENYISDAKDIIEDKKKVYHYPTFTDDFIQKIILDLIDECYLSFDEKGIYDD